MTDNRRKSDRLSAGKIMAALLGGLFLLGGAMLVYLGAAWAAGLNLRQMLRR